MPRRKRRIGSRPQSTRLLVDCARGARPGRGARECIARARRDKAPLFALHTSELMSVALPMYQRMGFAWHAAAPDIHGVAYSIYLKQPGA